METAKIQEAKTQMSRLIEKIGEGEPFIIAKAGKPVAKVIPMEQPKRDAHKVGIPPHEKWVVPEDRWSEDEIPKLLGVME
jgi:prevent-host-death family protein